jgi:hypothetical protein
VYAACVCSTAAGLPPSGVCATAGLRSGSMRTAPVYAAQVRAAATMWPTAAMWSAA